MADIHAQETLAIIHIASSADLAGKEEEGQTKFPTPTTLCRLFTSRNHFRTQ